MKAITLFNPWAELVALKEKKNETRDWATKYRGPIAIHAAKSTSAWHMGFSMTEPFFTALAPIHRLSSKGHTALEFFPGCVLAIAELVDCVKVIEADDRVVRMDRGYDVIVGSKEYEFGDYSLGRYIWILENIHRLPDPVPAKGAQRIWEWSPPAEVVEWLKGA